MDDLVVEAGCGPIRLPAIVLRNATERFVKLVAPHLLTTLSPESLERTYTELFNRPDFQEFVAYIYDEGKENG